MGREPAANLTMLDCFAENLSRHGDIDRAASGLGQSKAWGRRMYRELCRRLGEQAI